MGRTTALLAAGALAVTAGLTAAAPAMASSHALPPAGQFKMCLKSDHSLCIRSNGTGNDTTVNSTSQSTWNINSAGCGGSQVVNIQNQSGNYLRAKNAGDVQVSSTCDANSEWSTSLSGGVIVYTNVGTGGKLSVNSDTNGATVYVGKSWLITSLS